jgi:asparagine synthase (glutamine-hydrolysing)
MCGISAIIGSGAFAKEAELESMIQSISHRGEVTESYLQENFIASVRRLKIVDRENAIQPIFNKEGSKCILFNGEIFNHQELRKELENEFLFGTKSDTEVILASYEHWGIHCLKRFNGQYSFVIVDVVNNKWLMVRDEIGIIPLYYTEKNGLLYIASEIKSLTFLHNKITTLLPGTYIENMREPIHHFIPKQKIFYDDVGLFEAKLKEKITSSIQERVDTDLPIGVVFSGGLDSSIVLSQAIKYHSNVTAFTIGTEGCEDFEVSQRFCKEQNINQILISLSDKDFSNELIKATIEASELSEYGDIINAVITMQLYKRIKKENIKVVIGGDGSDELFGGYNMYNNTPESERIKLFNYKLMNLHRTELQRVDRCSMAYSVEVRVPFLDKELVKLALSIPNNWKIKDGIEKWCIRQAFKEELPSYIINRRKNPLSHSSGLHEIIRKHKYRFAQFFKDTHYQLNEPIHKDFSYVLNENKYDCSYAIEAAKLHIDYSYPYLLMEYAKVKSREVLMKLKK